MNLVLLKSPEKDFQPSSYKSDDKRDYKPVHLKVHACHIEYKPMHFKLLFSCNLHLILNIASALIRVNNHQNKDWRPLISDV